MSKNSNWLVLWTGFMLLWAIFIILRLVTDNRLFAWVALGNALAALICAPKITEKEKKHE